MICNIMLSHNLTTQKVEYTEDVRMLRVTSRAYIDGFLPHYPEKVRYKVIGGEMKGMESSMNLVALGATQRKG